MISAFSYGDPERRNAEGLIELALAEDLDQAGDITSAATIPREALGRARLVARDPGVLAGLPVVQQVVEHFDLAEHWRAHLPDGATLERGSEIADLAGSVRAILALERTALNFLQRLSGIATHTARFVAATRGTRAAIYDTRKTTPGWRVLEKYAVRCGGGRNHRMGLFDAVLIKDNHLDALRSQGVADAIGTAIASARRASHGSGTIEVEVDTVEQLDAALRCGPDIILVDNLGLESLVEAVRRRDASAPGIALEASGGISLDTISAVARTGVDRISVGALTHSAPALDIALELSIAVV
jgi:nicotinate-nucleotide pyrophosphorylase (carboxylating)